MRRPLLAGNWKMYKSAGETTQFIAEFAPKIASSKDRDVVLCAPFPSLPAAVNAADGTRIEIGAQDVFWLKEGAYTGEVSAPMLAAVGCQWVIIGHSERRHYFHETDETVLKKTQAALESNLKPIVCVGERLEERESGATESVLSGQFERGIASLTPEEFGRLVIAYEPVWAIGTGRTATPEIASSAHHYIRTLVREKFGDDAANACRILYGGSVKPDNISALQAQADVDGALVGGASLDPTGFAAIVNYK